MVSKKNKAELLELVQAYGKAKYNEGCLDEWDGHAKSDTAKEITAAAWAEIQFFINNVA
jgi:hypothetical protein